MKKKTKAGVKKIKRGIIKVATIPARLKIGNKATNKALKKLGYQLNNANNKAEKSL